MRYIKKTSPPVFFINAIEKLTKEELTNWKKYNISKKPLREYILKNEQKYLCVYCESKISADKNSSHIEHIKPKSQNKFPELTFEYSNLAVSCNGTCNNEVDDNTKYNCGHIKENEYNEDKFLNPVELINIRDYFQYDIDALLINSSDKDLEKANYMISTLNLNSGKLKVTREKIYKKFKQEISKIEDISKRKQMIKQRLSQEDIEQISFLRCIFKNFLK
jgi:uncharacterized protein (TIGR02646 family)